MGMDGLSISNTGIVKEKTSAELASKTEQAMQADATNNPKQVQSLSTNQRVRSKDEDEENSKKNKQNNEFNDGLVESEAEELLEEDESDIEDIENPNKDFYVKLNVKDDIIELYETISGNELGELIQKLNMASGIFVNKKV